MTFVKNRWTSILILCIVAAGIWLRATVYGDLRLSIGMPDTKSYIASSRAGIFSAQAFTGRRLFTTNLLYKMLDASTACGWPVISNPAEGVEKNRSVRPCFDRIVFLQNLISIIGWCFLALTTARWLKHPLYRLLAVILILAFGFTPQIAEWDSVLSSESLSLSLFPIIFAVLQEIVLGISNHRDQQYPLANKLLIPAWMVVFMLWVFIRDAHLYAIAVTLLLLSPFLLAGKFRQTIIILPIAIILSGLLIFGSSTAGRSTRWQPSLTHVLEAYIFPYPARTEYFTGKLYMPEDRSGEEYAEWFDSRGVRAYGKFLFSHPGFVIAAIIDRSGYFRSDFTQPYFKTSDIHNRDFLLIVGEAVHPETNAVYVIDTFLLLSLCITAIKYHNETGIAWAWLALWMFVYAAISLLISFFGDTDGMRRHIFPSVEILRLFLWVFLLRTLDSLIETR